jgi:hypothetical protein
VLEILVSVSKISRLLPFIVAKKYPEDRKQIRDSDFYTIEAYTIESGKTGNNMNEVI